MKKQFKKQSQQTDQLGNRIEWKNVPHQAEFNPTTNWYGIIDFDKAPSQIVEYTCRVRSEAVAVFEEEARLSGGKLGVVSAFK